MMERVGDREEKMEGSCSKGQSPQWAVVPIEEEEEEEEEEGCVGGLYFLCRKSIQNLCLIGVPRSSVASLFLFPS
jgi:hypothetical protein